MDDEYEKIVITKNSDGLLLLMVAAASIDGEICDAELEFMLAFSENIHGDDKSAKEKVDEFIGVWSKLGDERCTQVVLDFVVDKELRAFFYFQLVELMFVDGFLHDNEERMLENILKDMELKKVTVGSIKWFCDQKKKQAVMVDTMLTGI